MNQRSIRRVRLLLVVVFLSPMLALGNNRIGSYSFDLPLGINRDLWSYFIPKDNPLTAEKVELGRRLFFDPRLSADGSVSCSSCHDPALAFADGRKVSEGVGGRKGKRNSPSILNAMFNSGQFWDGRAPTLEAQARMPLIDPDEMANESFDEVVDRLRNLPEYVEGFERVFGGQVTIESISRAIAAFERTLLSGDAPYDRFIRGERGALSETAQRGLLVFRTRGRCTVCHSLNPAFPFLTDQNYRNTGVAARDASFTSMAREAISAVRLRDPSPRIQSLASARNGLSLGRFLVTGNSLDIGAFRTPSLRNVELTAPYFHDGSAATLEEVIEFYRLGGIDNPGRDWELHPVDLSDDDARDLIEFLKSLTGTEARRALISTRISSDHNRLVRQVGRVGPVGRTNPTH